MSRLEEVLKAAEANPERAIFISRSGAQRDLARWIAGCLEARGYVVILQDHDFKGADFMLAMDGALRTGARVLALVSREYLDSPHCMKEATTALDGQMNSTGRLLLLQVDDSKPEGLLRNIDRVDFVAAWRTGDERIAKEVLFRALEASPSLDVPLPLPPAPAVYAAQTEQTDSEPSDDSGSSGPGRASTGSGFQSSGSSGPGRASTGSGSPSADYSEVVARIVKKLKDGEHDVLRSELHNAFGGDTFEQAVRATIAIRSYALLKQFIQVAKNITDGIKDPTTRCQELHALEWCFGVVFPLASDVEMEAERVHACQGGGAGVVETELESPAVIDGAIARAQGKEAKLVHDGGDYRGEPAIPITRGGAFLDRDGHVIEHAVRRALVEKAPFNERSFDDDFTKEQAQEYLAVFCDLDVGRVPYVTFKRLKDDETAMRRRLSVIGETYNGVVSVIHGGAGGSVAVGMAIRRFLALVRQEVREEAET